MLNHNKQHYACGYCSKTIYKTTSVLNHVTQIKTEYHNPTRKNLYTDSNNNNSNNNNNMQIYIAPYAKLLSCIFGNCSHCSTSCLGLNGTGDSLRKQMTRSTKQFTCNIAIQNCLQLSNKAQNDSIDSGFLRPCRWVDISKSPANMT